MIGPLKPEDRGEAPGVGVGRGAVRGARDGCQEGKGYLLSPSW